jgi:[ribosomal protein S18]-alanine N-acetyltransferase
MLPKLNLKNHSTPPDVYISALTVEDVSWLEPLENETQLAYWGKENYLKFLEEYPEYFGCKAVLITDNYEHAIIGFFLARSLFENLEILKIGIYKRYQGLGIGKQLLECACSEGIRRGCTRCFLEVRKSNENAIRFYYAQKFQIAATRLNYYSNPVEDAWVMERKL